jgi:hypothetical protein
MPPSGFESVEVQGIATSTHSLLSRFMFEVESGKHTSLEVGIATELATIDRALADDISHAERGVLMFVRELYLELKEGGTLQQIAAEIEALSRKAYV